MRDWDKIAALEQAIKEKYGEHVVRNPKSDLTTEKIQQYNEEYRQRILRPTSFDSEKDPSYNSCEKCSKLLRTILDDIYFIKHKCCNHCFIQHIEGREEKK